MERRDLLKLKPDVVFFGGLLRNGEAARRALFVDRLLRPLSVEWVEVDRKSTDLLF